MNIASISRVQRKMTQLDIVKKNEIIRGENLYLGDADTEAAHGGGSKRNGRTHIRNLVSENSGTELPAKLKTEQSIFSIYDSIQK